MLPSFAAFPKTLSAAGPSSKRLRKALALGSWQRAVYSGSDFCPS